MVTVYRGQTFFEEVAREEKEGEGSQGNRSAWTPWSARVCCHVRLCTYGKQTLVFSKMQIEELYI